MRLTRKTRLGLPSQKLPETRATFDIIYKPICFVRVLRTIKSHLSIYTFGPGHRIPVLFLSELGFRDEMIGVCLSAFLCGDLVISLSLTTHADRLGRRKTLQLGGLLKVLPGMLV